MRLTLLTLLDNIAADIAAAVAAVNGDITVTVAPSNRLAHVTVIDVTVIDVAAVIYSF